MDEAQERQSENPGKFSSAPKRPGDAEPGDKLPSRSGTGPKSHPKSGPTDVAALAGGAVAASIALAAEDGPYGALSLTMSLSLLLIVYGYVWEHWRTKRQSAATAGAVGIASIPGIGFILELAFCAAGTARGSDGSRVDDWMVAAAWAAVTAGCFAGDRKRHRLMRADTPATGEPGQAVQDSAIDPGG